MKLNKQEREELKQKYDGRCTYCGDKLGKIFHIDHIIPIRRNEDGTCMNPHLDTYDNLTPSCPSCNRMKSSLPLESFRSLISNFVNSLNNQSTQYKFAKRYGLVQETNQEVKFYFEKIEDKNSLINTIKPRVYLKHIEFPELTKERLKDSIGFTFVLSQELDQNRIKHNVVSVENEGHLSIYFDFICSKDQGKVHRICDIVRSLLMNE